MCPVARGSRRYVGVRGSIVRGLRATGGYDVRNVDASLRRMGTAPMLVHGSGRMRPGNLERYRKEVRRDERNDDARSRVRTNYDSVVVGGLIRHTRLNPPTMAGFTRHHRCSGPCVKRGVRFVAPHKATHRSGPQPYRGTNVSLNDKEGHWVRMNILCWAITEITVKTAGARISVM